MIRSAETIIRMEAATSSEMLLPICQDIQHHITENIILILPAERTTILSAPCRVKEAASDFSFIFYFNLV
jgi:hypothetical protein